MKRKGITLMKTRGYGFNFVDEEDYVFYVGLNGTEKDYILDRLIGYEAELKSLKRGFLKRSLVGEEGTLKEKIKWVSDRIGWVMSRRTVNTDELRFANDINGIN